MDKNKEYLPVYEVVDGKSTEGVIAINFTDKPLFGEFVIIK
jgi:hypothetical protein